MTTMLDRVAEAICQADEQNGGPPWVYIQSLGKHAVNGYYDRARAAITAMREPTQAMCDAGFPVPPDDRGRFDNYPEQHRLAMAPKWRAMIDKALE